MYSKATAQILSGKELEQSMYWRRQKQNGCVRLLNRTHTIGCAFGPTEAPLQFYNDTSSFRPGKLHAADRL